MIIFLAATPSASRHPQVGGRTSPAWVKLSCQLSQGGDELENPPQLPDKTSQPTEGASSNVILLPDSTAPWSKTLHLHPYLTTLSPHSKKKKEIALNVLFCMTYMPSSFFFFFLKEESSEFRQRLMFYCFVTNIFISN